MKLNYNEIFNELSKWGDRSPIHINITPAVMEFLFSNLGMDPKSGLKDYKQKNKPEILVKDILIPKEFITKISDLIGRESVSVEVIDRVRNSIGKSYLDILRSRIMTIPSITQMVVYPSTHEEIVNVIELANSYNICIGTVAGGTSVIQGIEATNNGIIINTKRMNKIIEVNKKAQYVVVQPGIYGPDLEQELNEIGFCVNHTPQSFEYSCVGGWVATRGAGQQSTLFGKIEDMVLGLKVVTGSGKTLKTKIAPARSSGPDLNQIFTGSEGSLGIITEVVLRINRISESMKFSSFMFKDFSSGLEACREIMQQGLKPSVLRLSDADETFLNIAFNNLMKTELKLKDKLSNFVLKYLSKRGYLERKRCLLIVISEGVEDIAKTTNRNVKKICKRFEGFSLGSSVAKSWIKGRYEAPFLRDPFVDHGVLVETLETATTWDRLLNLQIKVKKALKTECSIVMSHISHTYTSGANIYFTMITKQEDGLEEEQYLRIKNLALNTFMANGSVISHHHGIGRAFNNWLEEEISTEGIRILKALKKTTDPNWLLNNGIFDLKKEN